MTSRTAAVLGALVALPLLTGCGETHREAVVAAATAFHRAHSDGDGVAACAVLSPSTRSELAASAGKPCPAAVLEEAVAEVTEPRDVQVFGAQAKVDYAGETTFLARFQGVWRVMAAGCTPRPGRPYDCGIEGG